MLLWGGMPGLCHVSSPKSTTPPRHLTHVRHKAVSANVAFSRSSSSRWVQLVFFSWSSSTSQIQPVGFSRSPSAGRLWPARLQRASFSVGWIQPPFTSPTFPFSVSHPTASLPPFTPLLWKLLALQFLQNCLICFATVGAGRWHWPHNHALSVAAPPPPPCRPPNPALPIQALVLSFVEPHGIR